MVSLPTALNQRFVGCVLRAGGGAAASEFTSLASQKGASWSCLLAWSEVCSSCVWEGAPSHLEHPSPLKSAAYWLGEAPSASPKWECVKVCPRWGSLSKAETSPLGRGDPRQVSGKAVENNFRRQGCFLPSEPAGGLPFGPFLGPFKLSLHPHTVLSLALTGGIPSPLPLSPAPLSSARTPSLVSRSEALFLGARPGCLGGSREGAQDPEPSLTPPPPSTPPHTRGLGGWEVGGGRLAREGKS